MIVMFIGPSSCGKDTFYNITLNNFRLKNIILHTTRPIRNGEVDGKSYYFVTSDVLDKLDNDGLLIERRDYNTMYGIWSYATSSSSISLDNNYITTNTWDGYKSFLNYYGRNIVIPLYFKLDKGLRLQRALRREMMQDNPKYDELCRRYLADEKDFTDELIEKYNPYIIDNNGSVSEAQEQINNCLKRTLKN